MMKIIIKHFKKFSEHFPMLNIYWKLKLNKFLLNDIVCIRILLRRDVKGEIPLELRNMQALAWVLSQIVVI